MSLTDTHGESRASINTRKFIYAMYQSNSPAGQADVGLSPKLSSPVKVIGVHSLGKMVVGRVDYNDAENWVLELESPLMCFTGRLSFNDPKSWTTRVKMSLKVSFESYLMEQKFCADEHVDGHAHEHFRWFMYLSDFLKYFTELRVYHKSQQYPYQSSYDGFHEHVTFISPTSDQTDDVRRLISLRPFVLISIFHSLTYLLVARVCCGSIRRLRRR